MRQLAACAQGWIPGALACCCCAVVAVAGSAAGCARISSSSSGLSSSSADATTVQPAASLKHPARCACMRIVRHFPNTRMPRRCHAAPCRAAAPCCHAVPVRCIRVPRAFAAGGAPPSLNIDVPRLLLKEYRTRLMHAKAARQQELEQLLARKDLPVGHGQVRCWDAQRRCGRCCCGCCMARHAHACACACACLQPCCGCCGSSP